jgi:ubiquinone biosynthesis protein COQ9
MKKNNFDKKRLDILNILKKSIINDGWNENLFKKNKIIKNYKKHDIVSLFPNGYISLLKFYLSNADNEMAQGCKKLNLAKMRKHEKVNAIILLKLKMNQRDKDLVKRTFFTLLLPYHSKLLTYSIHNTVNKIWYIAGDFSEDYNYYSKRLILASIYSTTVFYWLNNKTFEQTKIYLDKKLQMVSKIPKIKKRIKQTLNKAPKVYSFAKNVANFMQ